MAESKLGFGRVNPWVQSVAEVDNSVRRLGIDEEAIREFAPQRNEAREEERKQELERFHRYRDTGDLAAREAIIMGAQGLATGLARRFRDRGAEFDDLIQVAQIGLLNAVERFDPSRGIPFISFATPTILGELRRHFRTVWSVRVPRSLQEASQRIAPALSELHQELGRTPTVQEIGTRIGATSEQVLEAMEAGAAFRVRSLDAPTTGDDGAMSGLHGFLPDRVALAVFDQIEARQTVERLLPLLSPRSRRIVKLRFFDQLSQADIAEKVGISQMHVSRLLQQALSFFAGVLSESDEISDVC